MIINGLFIYKHDKDKNTGISYIGATLSGQKNDFPETKNWDENEEWIKDPGDEHEFAVAYHTIYEIRKKYPILYLLASKVLSPNFDS